MKKLIITMILFHILQAVYCDDALKDIVDNYVRYNNWSQAATALSGYLQLHPDDAEGYALAGLVSGELTRYDESIMLFRKAINYAGNDEKKGEYYYNLGSIYYRQKLYDIALETLNKATELNPLLAGSYYLEGLINFEKNNNENAVVMWNKYVKYTTDAEKKSKVEEVLARLSEKIEGDRKKKEEEEKRKQELLDLLKGQLDSKSDQTNSLQDYKINKDKNTDEDFELID